MPDMPNHAAVCAVCSSPTGDAGQLCTSHTDELSARLGTVKALVVELEVTITRQSRTAANLDGGRSPETPLDWNENASARAFELGATLDAWALDVSHLAEDERDQLTHVPRYDTGATAAWLLRNINTLRHHDEAGLAFDEIRSAVREGFYAIDRAACLVPFGMCGRVFEAGEVCQATLYGALDRPRVRCRECGGTRDTRELLEGMLGYLQGMLATLPELVAHASLAGKRTTEDKLRLMISRDRFLAVGTTPKGEPTYRVAEMLKALEERYVRRPKVAGAA